MARKNKLEKTEKYSFIKYAKDKNGKIEYFSTFTINNKRYPDFNITKKLGAKTLEQAKNLLEEFKREERLKADNPVIEKKIINDLFKERIENIASSTAYIYEKVYEAHIKDIIGHKYIDKVTLEDLKNIKSKVVQKDSTGSLETIRKILSPIFRIAKEDGLININYLKRITWESKGGKVEIDLVFEESMLEAIRKIYNGALKYNEKYRAYLLMNIMTARRRGELLKIRYEDIKDDIVNVRSVTTKTLKRKNENTIVEQYPIPKEVLELIKPTKSKKGLVFPFSEEAVNENYTKMMKEYVKLRYNGDFEETQAIRGHENRNFLISICGAKFGMDLVGNMGLSHSPNKAINKIYISIPLEDKRKVYEYYWDLLRGNENVELSDFEKLSKVKDLLESSDKTDEKIILELKKLLGIGNTESKAKNV